MGDQKPDFADEFETDPPMPVESAGQIANICTDDSNIPKRLFPEEHTAEVGDLKVIRSRWDCPMCGSNVFLHPDSVCPHNTVFCFECSHAPFGIAWWEDARLNDIVD
jgi:hypothetical protein